MSLDPVVGLALRGALAWLFVASAWHKLRDLPGFRTALAGYRLLPAPALGVAAAGLAALELAIGLACLWPAAAPTACRAGALLLALYSLAIACNLARGRREIDCGCGGPGGRRPLGIGLVLRNGVLVALLLLASLRASPRALLALDAVTAAGLLGVLALLHAGWDVALANASRLRDADRIPEPGAAA